MKSKFLILFLFLLSISVAQNSKGEWVAVDVDGQDKVYIDVSGIENFLGEDIYIWASIEHSIPIVIESIDEKVHKTKTYYLFNTRLNKYSLLHVIYYDSSNNVLRSFNYSRSTKIESYQYNFPIWEGSIEEKILHKCLRIINNKKK